MPTPENRLSRPRRSAHGKRVLAVVVATTTCTAVALSLSWGGAATAISRAQVATRSAARAAVRQDGVPRASHMFVIVGENTSLKDLTRRNAPYISGTLRPRSAWLRGYQALGNSSSTGDYIQMTSGQSIACERQDSNPVNPDTDRAICTQHINNVFTQLERHRISWRLWSESAPHACAFYDDGTDWAHDVYSAHHNPAIYYDAIEGHRYVEDFGSAPRALCRRHVVPMGTTAANDTSAFDAALARGRVPRFNFIVPNDCQDGHDDCGTGNPIGQFDAFARREVARIEASPAWDSHSVIDVTWDEQGDATPHNLRVGSIWTGPQVRPGVYQGRWNHSSLLRTVEDAYGLSHLRGAKRVHTIRPMWR